MQTPATFRSEIVLLRSSQGILLAAICLIEILQMLEKNPAKTRALRAFHPTRQGKTSEFVYLLFFTQKALDCIFAFDFKGLYLLSNLINQWREKLCEIAIQKSQSFIY
jgi:hypothetical protein